ncbi:twin-arginine translocase TatA/TatE family subunit [Hippea alviniae]|uniref:twin-arginine translocase TatA/TatE family subunit n=1 Tax=Hippea alviniae TaxID=1279027 RepID=UPI0003B42101|nr:twin-arginine translocase TatA/TatE family subunit [Hippea alviniae]
MLPSMQEMLPILVLLLIIFGARKLPEIGAGLGKGIKEFKKSMKDIDEEDDKKIPVEHKKEEVDMETKEKTTDKEEV